MKKYILIILLAAAGMISWHPEPADAGGPFRDTLFNAYCSGLPYHERVGCNGYLQYRIQRGKSRQESIDKCIWGCGEVLDDPSQIENCRKGCRDANAKDN